MIYTLTANPSLDKLYTLDKLDVGQYNRGTVERYDPGGKGINVSRCLQAFGMDSVILGFFAGNTGEALIKTLKSQTLSVDPVLVDGESRSNITLIENSSGRMTKLNEYGPAVDQTASQALMQKIAEKTEPGDIWVLSGSLSPGLPDDYYAQLINVIQDHGGLAFLDTSGNWLIHGYKAGPDLLRINSTEAETILGRKLDTGDKLLEALSVIDQTGTSLSVISLGAEGAIFSNGESVHKVSAPIIDVKTPVGAGDAMMATIIYGYVQGWPLEKIAAWSVAAGSASAKQAGTAAVSPEQIHALLDQVNVNTITH